MRHSADTMTSQTRLIRSSSYNTLDRFNEFVIVVVTSEFSPVVATLATIAPTHRNPSDKDDRHYDDDIPCIAPTPHATTTVL